MITIRLRPSSGRSARSCCIARTCSMVMYFMSLRFARSTRRVTTMTSGWMPFSIFVEERHVPQPPAIRGSDTQFSVCANRSATVFLPIDRGPLSSYAWATSPRIACSPSLPRRRRCPITSRIGLRTMVIGQRPIVSAAGLCGCAAAFRAVGARRATARRGLLVLAHSDLLRGDISMRIDILTVMRYRRLSISLLGCRRGTHRPTATSRARARHLHADRDAARPREGGTPERPAEDPLRSDPSPDRRRAARRRGLGVRVRLHFGVRPLAAHGVASPRATAGRGDPRCHAQGRLGLLQPAARSAGGDPPGDRGALKETAMGEIQETVRAKYAERALTMAKGGAGCC